MNQHVTYLRAECQDCHNQLWGLRSDRRRGSGWLHEVEVEDVELEHRATPATETVEEVDFATWWES